MSRLRSRLYGVLELAPSEGRLGQAVHWALIGLIAVTIAATVLETVPRLTSMYRPAFEVIEDLALAVFSAEYLARVWTAAENPPWRPLGPVRSRIRFLLSPPGVVGLAAVLPFWLPFVYAADFRTLLVLRLVRFFKLTRYSPAMRSLLEALYAEQRALVGCFVILCGATLIAAAFMHLAEGTAQPDKFGTIPNAMWWAIVTL